jgi:hypothetical protein
MRGCGLFCERGVRPLGLSHSFRLQINSVNLVALGCHNQRSISNVQRLDKNPLNVLLERWVNPIREDRQIPKLFVGLNIPSLNWLERLVRYCPMLSFPAVLPECLPGP